MLCLCACALITWFTAIYPFTQSGIEICHILSLNWTRVSKGTRNSQPYLTFCHNFPYTCFKRFLKWCECVYLCKGAGYVYMLVSIWVCAYKWTPHKCQSQPPNPQKLELQWLSAARHGFWEPNSGPQEKQWVLLSTEPFLSTHAILKSCPISMFRIHFFTIWN